MLPIQDNNFAINSMYAGMFAQVSNLTNTIISNSDLTGASFAQNSIQTSLAENTERHESISEGISMIQATEYAVDTISDKVDRMKELAAMAAGGSYTQQEIDDFQVEFDELAEDINELAVTTTPGGNNILNKQGSTVSVSIGSGLSIDVDTTVMTVTGLAIINNMDLTSDPEGAIKGLEAAETQIASYSAHLGSKADSLTTSLSAVEAQRESFLVIQSSVESIDAAMTLASSFNAVSGVMSSFAALLTAQANLNNDSVMHLLVDNETG
jgi:flagellin